jgi:hypothetical protein
MLHGEIHNCVIVNCSCNLTENCTALWVKEKLFIERVACAIKEYLKYQRKQEIKRERFEEL